jgi:hypothetical protein
VVYEGQEMSIAAFKSSTGALRAAIDPEAIVVM